MTLWEAVGFTVLLLADPEGVASDRDGWRAMPELPDQPVLLTSGVHLSTVPTKLPASVFDASVGAKRCVPAQCVGDCSNAATLTSNTPIPQSGMVAPTLPTAMELHEAGISSVERCIERYSDACWATGAGDWRVVPAGRLWEIPLANQREPRSGGHFFRQGGQSVIDTLIGAQIGLLRWSPTGRPFEGWQLDGFGLVMSRFTDDSILATHDYRAGVPLTYSFGPWQGKIGYEHTSSHLGDDLFVLNGQAPITHVRDEIVLGLSRRLDAWRAYGQFGYSFGTHGVVGNDRTRFDVGLEWSCRQSTGIWGQPFAAVDVDLRSDQDFEPNVTLQVGWQWLAAPTCRSVRVALEYYTGKSKYGQFYLQDEDWLALAVLLDF